MDPDTKARLKEFARSEEVKVFYQTVASSYPDDAWRVMSTPEQIIKEQGRQEVIAALKDILRQWATMPLNGGT